MKVKNDKNDKNVYWHDIMDAKWPKVWFAVGNPMHVPGGAIFIVRAPSAKLKRNIFTIMSWDRTTKTTEVVKIGDDPAIFMYNGDARDHLKRMAVSLREAA